MKKIQVPVFLSPLLAVAVALDAWADGLAGDGNSFPPAKQDGLFRLLPSDGNHDFRKGFFPAEVANAAANHLRVAAAGERLVTVYADLSPSRAELPRHLAEAHKISADALRAAQTLCSALPDIAQDIGQSLLLDLSDSSANGELKAVLVYLGLIERERG